MPRDPDDDAELTRVPGLFRRWELPQILEPGESFRLEDAGTTSDGTALLAVYRGVRGEPADRSPTERRGDLHAIAGGRLDDL